MVDPYPPLPSGSVPPPPPGGEPKRVPVGWIVVVVLSLAVIIVLIVTLIAFGGDDESAAGSDPSESSVSSAPSDSSAGIGQDDPAATSPPGDLDSGTTAPTGAIEPGAGDADPADPDPGPDVPEPDAPEPEPDPAVPFSWDPGVVITWEGDPDRSTSVDAHWNDAAGEDHYTWIFQWETDTERGEDEGTNRADLTFASTSAPCGAFVRVVVMARDAAGTELANSLDEMRIPGCTPEVNPPTNISGSAYIGHTVRFSWTPGSGYDRYAWESTVTSGSVGGTETGTIDNPDQPAMTVDASCGDTVAFTVVALMADGTEVGRLSDTYEAAPCPNVFVVAGPALSVAAGTGNGRTAACPAGSTVVGGGYRSYPETAAMPFPGWIYTSRPVDNGWLAQIAAPPERALSIQPYVVCMAHQESEVVATASHSISSGGLESVVVECPGGTAISGGGFDTSDVGLTFLVNAPDDNGWRVTALNPLSTSAAFRAYAVCVDGMYVSSRDAEITAGVADGEVGPGPNPACPVGSVLTGGGFASPDAYFEASYPVGSGALSWAVVGRNRQLLGPPGPAVPVEAHAVCLTFPP